MLYELGEGGPRLVRSSVPEGLEGRLCHRRVVEVAEGIRSLRDDRGDGRDGDGGGDEPCGSSRRLLAACCVSFCCPFLPCVASMAYCTAVSAVADLVLGAVPSCETPLPSNAAIYRRHNATSTTSDAPLVPWQRCTLSQV